MSDATPAPGATRWAGGLLVVLCVAYAVEPLLAGPAALTTPVLTVVVVAMVVFCLSLAHVVWRGPGHGRPWSLVASAVIGVGLFIRLGPDLAALPALTAGAAGFLLTRVRAVAVAGLTLGLLVVVLVGRGLPAGRIAELSGRVVLLMVVVWAAGTLVELTRREQRHRGERERLVVAEERLRIARDLHDLLGQHLSAISLRGEVAARLLDRDGPAARRELDILVGLARRSATEMRGLVDGYRRRSLDTEIDGARSVLAAAGIDVRTDPVPSGLPEASADALAWVAREATTNVLRHSDAGVCSIRFGDGSHDGSGDVWMQIANDRPGPRGADDGGHGLDGMAERLSAVGGSLDLEGATESEFVLRAHVPREVGTP